MPEQPEIIEAEIVQEAPNCRAKCAAPESGEPLCATPIRANEPPSWHTPGDHARPKGDLGGMLGGFLTLAVGFLVTVFILIVSVCIVIPFTLILRALGMRKRS